MPVILRLATVGGVAALVSFLASCAIAWLGLAAGDQVEKAPFSVNMCGFAMAGMGLLYCIFSLTVFRSTLSRLSGSILAGLNIYMINLCLLAYRNDIALLGLFMIGLCGAASGLGAGMTHGLPKRDIRSRRQR